MPETVRWREEMKIIIGYDSDQTILAAVIPQYVVGKDLEEDVLNMLRSGLTVNVVEIPKVVIGEKFDWSETKITRL
jgi:hypothetical protein